MWSIKFRFHVFFCVIFYKSELIDENSYIFHRQLDDLRVHGCNFLGDLTRIMQNHNQPRKSRGREEKYIAGLFNESLRFSKSVNSFSFLLQNMRNEKNTGERETDVQL